MDLSTLRHSTSHVMAQAVVELFPGTKLAIGPFIKDGFYYDFDTSTNFTPQDLKKIESKMREIIKSDHKFTSKEITKQEAKKLFKEETYKLELIDEIPEEKVLVYQHGPFVDLCRGPHIDSTGEIKYFKLLSIAGAYWRGDEHRQQLQRIYGTTFFTKKELDDYMVWLEEAKKRDHRKLGPQLDLYHIYEEAGAGLIFWHPKGSIIRNIIENFWKEEHLKNGYQLLYTPHIAKIDLWQTSGHLDFYRENMYSPLDIEGQKYILKPMNCPGHILIYKSKLRSYRDLPIRWAELGTVYRYERTGVMHGLFRVRGFTQDDAHIFCRVDQLEQEITDVIKLVLFILNVFGFKDYEIYLSTRPEEFVGEIENWDRAETSLKKAVEKLNLAYEIDPGAGVFYGPKLDIHIKDCLGRTWQCSTVQVDFNLPERFSVNFRNADGKDERAIMIHRALMGSLERFFGILIEHYAGKFPLWLAPTQVIILNISDKQKEYAEEVKNTLLKENIRVEADFRNETINHKIREATLAKIPYLIIVGDKEKQSQKISVRNLAGKNLGQCNLSDFISQLKKEISGKIVPRS